MEPARSRLNAPPNDTARRRIRAVRRTRRCDRSTGRDGPRVGWPFGWPFRWHGRDPVVRGWLPRRPRARAGSPVPLYLFARTAPPAGTGGARGSVPAFAERRFSRCAGGFPVLPAGGAEVFAPGGRGGLQCPHRMVVGRGFRALCPEIGAENPGNDAAGVRADPLSGSPRRSRIAIRVNLPERFSGFFGVPFPAAREIGGFAAARGRRVDRRSSCGPGVVRRSR